MSDTPTPSGRGLRDLHIANPLLSDDSDGEGESGDALVDNLPTARLPRARINVNGKWYRQSDPTPYRRGATPSWIYRHGVAWIDESTDKKVWKCGRCDFDKFISLSHTTEAANHLGRIHSISKDDPTGTGAAPSQPPPPEGQLVRRPQVAGPLSQSIDGLGNNNDESDDSGLDDRSFNDHDFDVEEFQKSLLGLIISEPKAFAAVQSPQFRNLTGLLRPEAKQYLEYHSQRGNNPKGWLMKDFKEQAERTREDLNDAMSRIHLSFEFRVVADEAPLIAIWAHFLNNEAERSTILLATRKMLWGISGENIVEIVEQVVQDFGIEPELGYFMADNDVESGRAIDLLLQQYRPELISTNAYRGRCLGDLINLTSSATLSGRESVEIEIPVEAEYDVIGETSRKRRPQKEPRRGRQKGRSTGPRVSGEGQDSRPADDDQTARAFSRHVGATRKLRNLSAWIECNIHRREEFQGVVGADFDDLIEGLDFSHTRHWLLLRETWMSARRLSNGITGFCMEHREEIGGDLMTPEDWNQIDTLIMLLKPFWETTQHLRTWAPKRDRGASWEFLPTIEFLLKHLKSGNHERDRFANSLAAQGCWELEKHINLVDQAQNLYGAAVLLNPMLKQEYFENHWGSDPGLAPHISSIVEAARSHWNTHYRPLQNDKQRPERDAFELRMYGQLSSMDDSIDEFERYLSYSPLDLHTSYDPITFWKERRITFPTLSLYAFDVLSFPATSAKIDRCFKDADLTWWDRYPEDNEVLNATECLRDWRQSEEEEWGLSP